MGERGSGGAWAGAGCVVQERGEGLRGGFLAAALCAAVTVVQ
jgi:hypothetical protein